jgi:5-methylcytosine-specific restriction endonuclease McrA
VFPTCNQPAYRCEPDHTIPFSQGGRTRRDNLALTCRRHNQAKAGTGWTYHHNLNGTFTWITATGHHYTGPTSQPWPQDPPF